MTNYRDRLLIPITGSDDRKFYVPSGNLFATGYVRVVIGDRGPYIEFNDNHIMKDQIHIPDSQAWRLLPEYDYVYYNEWRTNVDFVKLYQQRQTVGYADYRIGCWYVSPFAVKCDGLDVLVKPAQPQKSPNKRDLYK